MSKKTLALILGLLAVTIVLLVIALSPSAITKRPPLSQDPTPTPVMAFTTLAFSPSTATVSSSGSGEIDVVMNTNQNTVSGIQLEMQYNPKVLTNVSITTGPFFETGVPLMAKPVDPITGRIKYLVGMNYSTNSKPIQGSGVVAHIFFQRSPTAPAGITSTPITWLDESKVTQLGVKESVLKAKTPGMIVFGTNNAKIPFPTKSTSSPSAK